MKHTVSKIRDERLIADYKKGDKIRLLEAYYGISKQRIYQILDDNNVKKRNLLDSGKIRVYDLRKQARVILQKAIDSGELVRPEKCSRCGSTVSKKETIAAHHFDYTKPLEVVWLCRKCHAGEHKDTPIIIKPNKPKEKLYDQHAKPIR